MMSSMNDDFQVLLLSNVKGNPRNKPNLYEWGLAKPLDLPAEWDVPPILILYPHNWTKLDKSYLFFLLKRHLDTDDEPLIFVPNAEKDEQDLYDVITKVNVFMIIWKVDRGPQIPRGNYAILKISEVIESQFYMIFTNWTINLRMDFYQYRVEINLNVNFAIVCYVERSILNQFRFESQSTVIETPQKRAVKYMVFNANIYVKAKLHLSIHSITNMYVYSDIVELYSVSKSQVSIISFLSIKSYFQQRVIKYWTHFCMSGSGKNIRTISMKICSKTGENFLFTMIWSPVASTFAADHFLFRLI